jgi:hypothetical protein
MGFFRQLFGIQPARTANPAASKTKDARTASPQSRSSAPSATSARRELLRAVLRKTINGYGIPVEWIGAEVLLATSHGQEPGVHLRLLMRHWDPRLLAHAVALQNGLVAKVLEADPLASNWLMGVSWQFALPNERACPSMPLPGFWTAEPEAGIADTVPKADVDPEPPADVKADLEQLLAVRDAELRRSDAAGTEATQPLFLKTQAMKRQPVFDQTEPMPLGPDLPAPRR